MTEKNGATGAEEPRAEVSASTIARMMGLTTATEMKLVEGKIDLLTSKLSGVQVKLEKIVSMLGAMPTGADLERVDVQIGALRQLVREVLGSELGKSSNSNAEPGKNRVRRFNQIHRRIMTIEKSSLLGGLEVERTDGEAAAPAAPRTLADRIEKGKVRQKNYLMDLRVHSPVSLGYLAVGGIDTAPALVRLAKVKGLDMIAVTDFYSGAFIDRVVDAASDADLTVIPGTVIRCSVGICDDVSISCLFPEGSRGAKVQEFLSAIEVPASAAGDKRYHVKMPFATVLQKLEALSGIAMPSRIDKTPHRQTAIPMLVEQYGFRAFDLAYPDSAQYFKRNWPKTKFNLFCFSNAHALAQVGSRMAKIKLSESGFAGLQPIVGRDLSGLTSAL